MAKVYSLSGLIPSFLNNALASILRDKEIFFMMGRSYNSPMRQAKIFEIKYSRMDQVKLAEDSL